MHPQFRGAAYGGESFVMTSGDVRLSLFRRTTGWGWGELIGADQRLLGVLDHLGEVAVRDAVVPMRLEADTVERSQTADGRDRARFGVASVTTADALAGSSFERWVGVPFAGPLLSGDVVIEADGRGGFTMQWKLTSNFDVFVTSLRGPWLRVGQGSFGSARDQAILPGIEWALEGEWTSGDDWFRDPWGMRAVPPVESVGIPVMAVSHDGTYVAMEWDAAADATGWFSMAREHAQPVFASPNFVERNDSSLLGIMLPQARTSAGNAWHAETPWELHRGQRIALAARICAGQGTALDAVVDWVVRRGLPDVPGGDRDTVLHKIAAAYGDHLWHPGEGFGVGQTPGDIQPAVPDFVSGYLARFPDSAESAVLRARIATLEGGSAVESDELLSVADGFLAEQHDDGSFRFEPEGRHRSKDDFVVARDLVAPMGQAGDEALDFDALAAIALLRAHAVAPDRGYGAAARAALDHARRFRRPEAGDYWETPLHAPNLLAAGHGALAYALAWQMFGREQDRRSARHWMRSLLVFTHLWSPTDRPMLYNTKPCLCSSDWYFANWVRDHVQWEVLETFVLADRVGVDLAAVDDDVDWTHYRAGITWAAVRWLIEHDDDVWRPHNLPESLELYRAGRFDMCLPDTHNSTTGLYGGMAIAPNAVGLNLLALP